MSTDQPRAKAGWYPHPDMADTVQYWDGDQWTGQVAPAPAAAAASGTSGADATSGKVPCAYCREPIAPDASRCPHCSGLYFYCKRDKKLMPVTTKSKWVGVARGGRQDSHRCRGCGRIIAGAKW